MQYPGDCPRCGETMYRRMARTGPRAGSYFWGCGGYPDCRYTINIDDEDVVNDNDWTERELQREVVRLRAENRNLRHELQSRPHTTPNHNGNGTTKVKPLLNQLLKELHQDRWARFGDDAAEQARVMTQMIIKEREKL